MALRLGLPGWASTRQITTPAPNHSVFTGRMPFLPPKPTVSKHWRCLISKKGCEYQSCTNSNWHWCWKLATGSSQNDCFTWVWKKVPVTREFWLKSITQCQLFCLERINHKYMLKHTKQFFLSKTTGRLLMSQSQVFNTNANLSSCEH